MKPRHAAATRLLTVREVAGYLHVHRSTIYRLLKRNELPPALKMATVGALIWRKSTAGVPNGKLGHPVPELRTLAGRLGQSQQIQPELAGFHH
jgi:predicted DNA-binding transcriptional regulator AlpA